MHSFHRTDQELLDLLKTGDRYAFTIIYDRHCSSLFRTALNILGDTDIAKDVVQETFIMLFEKINERTIGNLQAYLFQTVKYQCFMHFRSGRILEKHLNKMNSIIASNSVEEEIEANELQAAIDQRIAALPEKCREVFYLSRVESLPNKKIAERLKISHKTVENQITKALKILHSSVSKLVTLLLFTAF